MTMLRSLPAVLVAAWLLTQIPSSTVAAQGAMKYGRFEWGAVGLVPNQTLRASIASVAGGLTVRASGALLDAQGRILAQTVPVSIGPGAFRSFDFRREALSAPGEPSTGRLQVRLVMLIEVDVARAPEEMLQVMRGLAVSQELTDALTGKTAESGMIGDIRTVISAEAALHSVNKDFY